MDRIHEWERLNNNQLAKIDRNQTIALFPVGHTQQHGPHLPQGTLNIIARQIAQETAELLVMTDRNREVILLPTLAYGADPADSKRPDLFTRSSSLGISAETLAHLVSEIATGIARNEFPYLFAVGFYPGADHCRALQKAFKRVNDAFENFVAVDTYSYIFAGAEANAAPDLSSLTKRRVSPIEQAAVDIASHAGTASTAMLLALDANLVARNYTGLEGIPPDNATMRPNWPGYYGGAPSMAEADLGRAILTQQAYRVTSLIRRVLAGESLEELPIHPGY